MNQPPSLQSPPHVLIVGFGAAGLAVVDALRQFGHTGDITVLSGEWPLPYDRPPLAKRYLAGEVDVESLALTTQARVDERRIRLLRGRAAVSLDLDARVVTDDADEEHPFDVLVIATGVRPRRLGLAGDVPAHYLRTLADADRLRNELHDGGRLLVIGAGFLGLEVAATAVARGTDVTVVEPAHEPLQSRLGPTAARLIARHEAHGVKVLRGRQVASSTPAARGVAVVLDSGDRVEADHMLVAIGSLPNVEWLSGNDLDLSDGVVCDEYCMAAPGVYAVGDVARWDHRALGTSVRLEHRMNAGEQGTAVARSILGTPRPFVPVPFFWTDQYDVRVQVAGAYSPQAVAETVLGDGDSYVETWRVDGQLVGALGSNAARALMPYRRELSQRALARGE